MVDHHGHRDRMRAEFLAHPDSFPDHRVLEMLLYQVQTRRDTNEIAHSLLERFGSMEGVMDAPPEALLRVKGVGERTVAFFKMVKELSRRYAAGRSSIGDLVDSNYAAYELLHPYFFGARNEMVYLMCLDGKKKLLGTPKLAEGNVNAAEVLPRAVVEAALNHNAARVILAHNHVSGLALPSDEDKATTTYLQGLLYQVGVMLDDHLIFVDDDMVSLRDSGFLK